MEHSESVFVPFNTLYFPHKIPQLQKQTSLTAKCLDPVPSNKATFFFFFFFFFFLSLNLLTGWQLSIWMCRKPFFSLLYNCQLLCFWRLALSIVVEVFPRPFFSKYCSFKDVMPNCIPHPRVASIF